MTEFEQGDRVIDTSQPSYGTGTVVRVDDTSPATLVDWDRRGRQMHDARDMEPAETMLRDVRVEKGKEWADGCPDGEAPIYGGQVTLDLDIADGVACDVDVIGENPDGGFRIIVQYWDDERREVDS